MNWIATPSPAKAQPKAVQALTVAPKTFLIMEFLGASDSRLWKQVMKRHGFKDVSPWDGKFTVPSFDAASRAKLYDQYRHRAATRSACLNARWVYLSGHHGIEQVAFYAPNTNDSFNDEPRAGFFNEPYHEGVWDGAGAKANSVFMASTSNSVGHGNSEAEFAANPKDNPFFKPRNATKGVINIACNTFTYRRSRMWFREAFPNAVVFGMFNTTPGGRAAITPFVGGQAGRHQITGHMDQALWEDPRSVLAPGGKRNVARIKDLCRKLNDSYLLATASRNAKGDIGIMVDDKVYYLDYDTGKKGRDRINAIKAAAPVEKPYDFRW